MTPEEAQAWLRGERSMTNIIMDTEPGDDRQLTLVRIAQADAAMCEQAYWVLHAGLCPRRTGDCNAQPQ